jgi:hypothetical protein
MEPSSNQIVTVTKRLNSAFIANSSLGDRQNQVSPPKDGHECPSARWDGHECPSYRLALPQSHGVLERHLTDSKLLNSAKTAWATSKKKSTTDFAIRFAEMLRSDLPIGCRTGIVQTVARLSLPNQLIA